MQHQKRNSMQSDLIQPFLVNDNNTNEVITRARKTIITHLLFAILTIALITVVVLLVIWMICVPPKPVINYACKDPCIITLVESIPENLTYPTNFSQHLSIFEGWINLINMAEHSIDIASFYWSLRGSDVIPDSSDSQGEHIYSEILRAGTERGIDIRIAQSQPTDAEPTKDTKDLAKAGAAEVRSLDFERFMPSHSGILHTKMWLVDGKHFFIGSANMDWRSLTQVKELGAIVYNCSCLAQDMGKIFETYWYMGEPNSQIPKQWPSEYETDFNITNPLQLSFNDTATSTLIASSPPALCPFGRSSDIDAILHVIDSAQSFVNIAVMDYIPAIVFTNPKSFWSIIDDKLRSVAYNKNIHVRLLGSIWNHTEPEMLNFLISLSALDGIQGRVEVKLFQVPAYTEAQKRIPFARVNHNKYMVTDNAAYVGTSNWSGDYFVSTGGIGFVVNQTSNHNDDSLEDENFQKQLLSVFERDWYSTYATNIPSV